MTMTEDPATYIDPDSLPLYGQIVNLLIIVAGAALLLAFIIHEWKKR